MHIEFLVEEASVEAALHRLVPKIVGDGVSFQVHPYQGKPDLLAKLPGRLKGYKAWLPRDWYIMVLVDLDHGDCRNLKGQLEQASLSAGFRTKSMVLAGTRFEVLNRIAVRELEAWFFGDVGALRAVYPRLSSHLPHQVRYRDPDAIEGGTWEALERLLQRHGYFRGGLSKIALAQAVSPHMQPDSNRSHSFRVFRDGLLALYAQDRVEHATPDSQPGNGECEP